MTVMWGLNFLVIKLLLVRWDPLALVAVRFAIMTILALAWTALSGGLRPIAAKDRLPIVVAGLSGVTLCQPCFVFSLQRTSVFASSLLASVFPIFTMLMLGLPPALTQNYAVLTVGDWLDFGYIVVFPIMLGYAILSWGIARIGAGPASRYASGVPIVGGIAGALAPRAPVTSYEIVGTPRCIAGLVVAQLAR